MVDAPLQAIATAGLQQHLNGVVHPEGHDISRQTAIRDGAPGLEARQPHGRPNGSDEASVRESAFPPLTLAGIRLELPPLDSQPLKRYGFDGAVRQPPAHILARVLIEMA